MDEIKKDRDQRIKKLRNDFDKLSMTHDTLQQEHSALNVKHNGLTEAHKNLRADHDVVTKNLHDANIMRQEIEEERTKSEKNKELLN